MVETIIRDINAVAWGLPMLILLLGTGIFLTAGLGFMTLRKVPRAVSLLFSGVSGRGEGDIAPCCSGLQTALLRLARHCEQGLLHKRLKTRPRP